MRTAQSMRVERRRVLAHKCRTRRIRREVHRDGRLLEACQFPACRGSSKPSNGQPLPLRVGRETVLMSPPKLGKWDIKRRATRDLERFASDPPDDPQPGNIGAEQIPLLARDHERATWGF